MAEFSATECPCRGIAPQHAGLTQARGCLEGSYMDISESSCSEVAETTLISTSSTSCMFLCLTLLYFGHYYSQSNTAITLYLRVLKDIVVNSPAQEMQQENKICLMPMQLHWVTRVGYSFHRLYKGPGSFLNRKIVFVQLSLRKNFSPQRTQVCWFSCLSQGKQPWLKRRYNGKWRGMSPIQGNFQNKIVNISILQYISS